MINKINDTVGNGLALSPTLHRAFDRGLIAIDQNYRIQVKKDLSEPFDSAYSIRQFDGKQILLPDNPRYYPHPDNLRWHRVNVFGY